MEVEGVRRPSSWKPSSTESTMQHEEYVLSTTPRLQDGSRFVNQFEPMTEQRRGYEAIQRKDSVQVLNALCQCDLCLEGNCYAFEDGTRVLHKGGRSEMTRCSLSAGGCACHIATQGPNLTPRSTKHLVGIRSSSQPIPHGMVSPTFNSARPHVESNRPPRRRSWGPVFEGTQLSTPRGNRVQIGRRASVRIQDAGSHLATTKDSIPNKWQDDLLTKISELLKKHQPPRSRKLLSSDSREHDDCYLRGRPRVKSCNATEAPSIYNYVNAIPPQQQQPQQQQPQQQQPPQGIFIDQHKIPRTVPRYEHQSGSNFVPEEFMRNSCQQQQQVVLNAPVLVPHQHVVEGDPPSQQHVVVGQTPWQQHVVEGDPPSQQHVVVGQTPWQQHVVAAEGHVGQQSVTSRATDTTSTAASRFKEREGPNAFRNDDLCGEAKPSEASCLDPKLAVQIGRLRELMKQRRGPMSSGDDHVAKTKMLESITSRLNHWRDINEKQSQEMEMEMEVSGDEASQESSAEVITPLLVPRPVCFGERAKFIVPKVSAKYKTVIYDVSVPRLIEIPIADDDLNPQFKPIGAELDALRNKWVTEFPTPNAEVGVWQSNEGRALRIVEEETNKIVR